MAQIVKYVISTKPDDSSESKKTVVEVDFEGFTLDNAKTMFFKSTSPRVAVQSALRHAKGGIPAKWAVKALDFATSGGGGERILTPAEMLEYAKSNPEYAEELRQLMGSK